MFLSFFLPLSFSRLFLCYLIRSFLSFCWLLIFLTLRKKEEILTFKSTYFLLFLPILFSYSLIFLFPFGFKLFSFETFIFFFLLGPSFLLQLSFDTFSDNKIHSGRLTLVPILFRFIPHLLLLLLIRCKRQKRTSWLLFLTLSSFIRLPNCRLEPLFLIRENSKAFPVNLRAEKLILEVVGFN